MNKSNSLTDEQLTALIKRGDVAAFTELYNRYWKLLFALVASKLQNLHSAEEIVQDVFADFWNRRASIEIVTSVQSFLSASVRYQTWRRMALDRKELKFRQAAGSAEPQTHSLISEVEAKFLFDQLQQRVSQLPPKCRLVYQLSRVEGLSNKEIAQQLDITEKAVERNMTRALKYLRPGAEVILIAFFTRL